MRSAIPWEGSILSSSNKRFEETVIFVHFFGGTKMQMRRHVDLVNEAGFDACTFNLSFDKRFWLKRLPLSRDHHIGLRHLWADEVEDVLNAIPGKKIIYAFSNPAGSAINAIVKRQASDVSALITDSGPFVHMFRCSWNLLTHGYPVKNRLLRIPATALLWTLWGADHSKVLLDDIAHLPKDFPVLSIRGWEDPLVPVSAIDAAYANVSHLKYETLALPKAGHLNGLKDFSEDYKPRVLKFLNRYAKPLKTQPTSLL